MCCLRRNFLLGILLAGLFSSSEAFAQEHVSAQERAPDRQSEKERKNREKKVIKESNPFANWPTEDVPYILTKQERDAFQRLSTDEEREQFVEDFWRRRNPDPDSPTNSFKEEYYRRIAYANERFASGVPGWKTDRGHMYILWGASG